MTSLALPNTRTLDYKPSPHSLAIIGEAPGKDEAQLGLPFVGRSGKELTRMLEQAGLKRSEIWLANLFNTRPPDNRIAEYCTTKADAITAYGSLREDLIADRDARGVPALANLVDFPAKYSWKSLTSNPALYLHPRLLINLSRLISELLIVRPNLVIAMGNSATWALLDTKQIGKIRGTIHESTLIPGLKVLPTYHPAAVLRQWDWRPLVISDLMKARREMEFPEIRRPWRKIRIPRTIEEALNGLRAVQAFGRLGNPLAYDVETARGQITTVGFALSKVSALVIPFCDSSQANRSYWQCANHEVQIWTLIKEILEDPSIPLLMQHGNYDVVYSFMTMGIKCRGFSEDSMVKHHAYMPEMRKGLDALGSLYTNEAAWKLERARSSEVQKRDE